MASIDLIRASNGSGDAVKATVTNARVISSTTIQVNATTNWPSKFIATVGSVDGTGAFVPATVTVFNGILSGGNIEITSFAPGYTDLGNTPGQVVVLKPTTAWANEVANTLAVAHNDSGTLKNDSVTTAAITDANVTTAKIANSAVTAPKIDFATLISNGNFQGGTEAATYYPSGSATTQTITFTKPFTSTPKVSVTPTPRSTGGSNYGEIYTVGVLTVSNSSMVISCRTNFSGNVAAQVTWTAIGSV